VPSTFKEDLDISEYPEIQEYPVAIASGEWLALFITLRLIDSLFSLYEGE